MKPVQEILWAKHSRDEFEALAEQGAVVIVPIASTEQHGLALPLDTDVQTVEYVARRGAQLASVPVLVTPTIPFGVSPHHMMYDKGTISLRIATVLDILRDVCESIIAHGFERILILSGHGGNGNTIGAAALEMRFQFNRQIQANCWFDLIPGVIAALAEGPTPHIGHAGEAEASAILFLSPDDVRQTKSRMVEGITDDPSLGTAAKGERILNAGAEALARLVERMAASSSRKTPGILPTK
ncbi:MAG: creatininase family protein [Chloroflexi bacterium]|jgi:creatinine amidohydrolase|nr:creatininase family protein [Chloroflexota bacterium]